MPITIEDDLYRLETRRTAYWFRKTGRGHLESLHYGARIAHTEADAFALKHVVQRGMSVAYDPDDPTYCLDTMMLEWSGTGKGDLRYAPCELIMPDGTYVTDFLFERAETRPGFVSPVELPGAYGEDDACETLVVTLKDAFFDLYLHLYYTVYEDCDVLTRRAVLENKTGAPVRIKRLMSFMASFPDRGYRFLTLDGGWIRECRVNERPLVEGRSVCESLSGDSSNRHNPGFMLAERRACEDFGRVYGFNLLYSGNHLSSVELSADGVVRVMSGINPHCFDWTLGDGEVFETPEAAMTFSPDGFNGMSQNFHDFVNDHIVRGAWKRRQRPVVVNSWEAFMFDFTHDKLVRLAERAKDLGAELFVLDDGWFGKRNDDKAGLGDYAVNRKKLPYTLDGLAREVTEMGLSFGLWFEPESVNMDSDLYRAHPEYAVAVPGRAPSFGRNQLLLDLCNPAVRDYIVESMGRVLDSANIAYVKWDMNRHLSDMYSSALSDMGGFYHRYILGLYDILRRIFEVRPYILLESCSSGGNRFDLGMLCFSPQIWASDDTDPIERLSIQRGLSYFYPTSTIGAHVSQSPHQQTLRSTPFYTRFNVAAFGLLGYELDLGELTPAEAGEMQSQVDFYKKHRQILQYGRFYRNDMQKDNKAQFITVGEHEAVAGFFQTRARAAEAFDRLEIKGLKPDTRYCCETVPQGASLARFGGLIKHVLPLKLRADGLILREAARHRLLPDAVERYAGTGASFAEGILLNNPFIGTGYDKSMRILGDFGSNLYLVTDEVGDGALVTQGGL